MKRRAREETRSALHGNKIKKRVPNSDPFIIFYLFAEDKFRKLLGAPWGHNIVIESSQSNFAWGHFPTADSRLQPYGLPAFDDLFFLWSRFIHFTFNSTFKKKVFNDIGFV